MSASSLFFQTPMQARTFLLLLFSGLIAGVLLCALRWAGKVLPCSVAAACDVVFCFLVCGLCALSLAIGGEGKMRWYAVLGMVCGCALSLTAIRLTLRLMQFLLSLCRKRHP